MADSILPTAVFLITVIICSAIILNAVIPAMQSASVIAAENSISADEYLRTDISVSLFFASTASAAGHAMDLWIKNTGTTVITAEDLKSSELFAGTPTDFGRLTLRTNAGSLSDGEWTYVLEEKISNGNLDPKESMHITAYSRTLPAAGNSAYFTFALPNGRTISETVTAV